MGKLGIISQAREAKKQLDRAKNCPYCQELQRKMFAHMEQNHQGEIT